MDVIKNSDIIIACLIIICLITVFCSIIVFGNRNKTKKTINRLAQMIDCAIDGSFTETIYDESTLSALETKLNRYLISCETSAHNLAKDKDKINSLISDISHQTKTPIANILLYSQLLSEKGELSKDSAESVVQICSQAEKLNFLIGALIKASRLETGIISVITTENSIDELITAVVEQITPKAKSKNIAVNFKLCGETAFFDIKWTQEALYNIVDNAIKYTKLNQDITITTMSYELFYCINVIDNGIGISENDINKIFGRFYRSRSVQLYEGVGIGLFLAREIICAQRGYIKVKSEIGKGSTFSIFLPKEM